MANSDWNSIWTAAFGAGFTVKLFDIGYSEIRRRLDSKKSTRDFLDSHLSYVLKSGDELFGKIRSLASQDFKPLWDIDINNDSFKNHDLISTLYLLCRFFASVEQFRSDGSSFKIASDIRGKRLQDFLACLESPRTRIVDRISQRASGELMLVKKDKVSEFIKFVEFAGKIETDQDFHRWVHPIAHVICRLRHTAERQKVLAYGSILQAMLDTLDPHHQITRDRPAYPNKLSSKTRQELKFRIFGRYLAFVSDPEKYLGPPKRRP